MLALAAPALGMRLGNPIVDLPGNVVVAQTLDKISLAFPGQPAPAEVVVTGHDLAGPRIQSAVRALEDRASAAGPIRAPITVTRVASGRGLIIDVPLAGNGSGNVSTNALLALRNQVLPQTLGKVSGVSYAVTGNTATSYDWSTTLRARMPVVFAVVAGLAFLVLMIAFRSVALPLVSVMLNLLSVAAAYGVITLIFQDGWLQGAARLFQQRRDRAVGAAVHVRLPVRAKHGLPRLHPQPDPREVFQRHALPPMR